MDDGSLRNLPGFGVEEVDVGVITCSQLNGLVSESLLRERGSKSREFSIVTKGLDCI
jgi:hypothetical protein